MRETQIKQEKGYLGPYQRILQPGDTQKMIFEGNDVGPFWMSPEERENRRHDNCVEGRVVKRKLTKKELTEVLLTRGITIKGKLVDLQRAATTNGISIEEVSQKIIEGWEGKPKGLLQVLWERGWVDNMDGKAEKNIP